MRSLFACAILISLLPQCLSLSIPGLSRRNPLHLLEFSPASTEDLFPRNEDPIYSDLEKRRGGGGGRGGGSSGGSSSGGSSGGGGRGGGSSGSSSSGGRGTSSTPSLAGGSRFPGGGATAYRSGSTSRGGITPFFFAGAALAFFPGVWLYGAYMYTWGPHYIYHNDTGDEDQSLPVSCYCGRYEACGCDEADNATVAEMLRNSSIANITTVNDTQQVVINGTLPNGTDDSDDATSAAAGLGRTLVEGSGFWLVGLIVGLMVWSL